MAIRTTDSAVRAIIETDTGITDLTPFMTFATELVDEVCVPAGYSDTRLELIERLLSAHFYCLRDMRAKSEKAETVAQTMDTELDLFFSHTHHGQMALMMDTAGGLANLQKEAQKEDTLRQVIGAHYIGIEDEDELQELDLD